MQCPRYTRSVALSFLRSENDYLATIEFFKRRRTEVGFLLRNPCDEILLTRKTQYPKEVYRIPTGGVKDDSHESVLEALAREVGEEFGLEVRRPIYALRIDYDLAWKEFQSAYTTHLFVLDVDTDRPPIIDFDQENEATLWENPKNLAKYLGILGALGGQWRSWGMFRSVLHRQVVDMELYRLKHGVATYL